jgi:hypothetical protein
VNIGGIGPPSSNDGDETENAPLGVGEVSAVAVAWGVGCVSVPVEWDDWGVCVGSSVPVGGVGSEVAVVSGVAVAVVVPAGESVAVVGAGAVVGDTEAVGVVGDDSSGDSEQPARAVSATEPVVTSN